MRCASYFAFGGGLMAAALMGLNTLVGFETAALVAVASTSRYIFAMARDGRFPAHRVMQRVNPRAHTPISATLLVLTIGVLLMVVLPGAALIQLISTGTILGISLYGMTVVLYLAVRRKFDGGNGGFDLGRFDTPRRDRGAALGGVYAPYHPGFLDNAGVAGDRRRPAGGGARVLRLHVEVQSHCPRTRARGAAGCCRGRDLIE